ncbi:electron transfer flavoprotein subunit beta/FixA family protein [Chloroflexota bacterium]
MALDIIVCIKQVPDPEQLSKITLDPLKMTLNREGIPSAINPLDRHALEEGLRIRESFSGKVTAISMGPPKAKEVLEEAFAMGVDDAVLLCDTVFAGADTLATAYTLAGAIKKIGVFDLVICGNETADSNTGQVAPQLAELLNVPHVTYVKEIDLTTERSWLVRRVIEHGYLRVALELPALIAVVKGINRPRLPSVMAIMEAVGKEYKTWGCGDIEVGEDMVGLAGSPTRVTGMFELEVKRRREILEGPVEEITAKAVKRLRELGVI